jgi:excinuclease ABC subunit B
MERRDKILYVSATPGPFELGIEGIGISEQIIRPTGLVDPKIEIRPTRSQVDELFTEIKTAVAAGGRVLITTLTKKMAEDLSSYYEGLGVRVRYLHSDIDSLERVEILRDLRKGDIDVIIGINLLREGLDLPEVSLVAVMDADKEGFLRSRSSLIQTAGRAARNSESRVIFFADSITASMKACIDETERRRTVQLAYNEKHGITPITTKRKLGESLRSIFGLSELEELKTQSDEDRVLELMKKLKIKDLASLEKLIQKKEKTMNKFAAKMEFEEAAKIRDEVRELKLGIHLFTSVENVGEVL